MLKHEPERRSGAAQPALLGRWEGKREGCPLPLGLRLELFVCLLETSEESFRSESKSCLQRGEAGTTWRKL